MYICYTYIVQKDLKTLLFNRLMLCSKEITEKIVMKKKDYNNNGCINVNLKLFNRI